MDHDYTEYVFNELSNLDADEISTFSMKDYIKFANELADLVTFIRSVDISEASPDKIMEETLELSDEEYGILLVEEFDDGEKSPFIIKRFVSYIIDSNNGEVKEIGQGACHHSPEISSITLAIPVILLLLMSFLIPIFSRLLGLISIPENCLDGMTYLIAPISFVIGLAMPFVINVITDFIGFELPEGHEDLMFNLPIIFVLVAIFRMSPMIGMVTVCIKANLYTEYLREKWFLFIVTIGGALGNMSWLILGMLMEMSYTGTMM